MAKAVLNRVRIIGGRHRGRWLPVPRGSGVRPSGDRVRETLFNWLQPVIHGARCLDLFAGSGALGFEAASREAERVVMVDRSGAVARQLRSNVKLLALRQVDVFQASLPDWLAQGGTLKFDPVAQADEDIPEVIAAVRQYMGNHQSAFFDGALMAPCCQSLQARGWLRPGAWVYMEADKQQGIPPLPDSWRLVKEKTAGRVAYCLARAGQ